MEKLTIEQLVKGEIYHLYFVGKPYHWITQFIGNGYYCGYSLCVTDTKDRRPSAHFYQGDKHYFVKATKDEIKQLKSYFPELDVTIEESMFPIY